MKRTKFSEAQIAFVLKQVESWTGVGPSFIVRLHVTLPERLKPPDIG